MIMLVKYTQNVITNTINDIDLQAFNASWSGDTLHNSTAIVWYVKCDKNRVDTSINITYPLYVAVVSWSLTICGHILHPQCMITRSFT